MVEGSWILVELAGAETQDRVNELYKRVDALLKATVTAREKANDREVERKEVAEPIFNYLFAE